METEQLAQLLFEAYSDAVGGKTVTDGEIPPWDQAQASAKEGWRAVAQAAQQLIQEDVALADNTIMTAAGPKRVVNAQTRNRLVAEQASASRFEPAADGGIALAGAGHDATGVDPNNEERQSQVKQIEAKRQAKQRTAKKK